MLKFCVLAAIVIVAVADPGAYRIYTNQRQFSLIMTDALCSKNPNENVFFSPHSTYRTLLLAYFGAEGETERSLKQGLHLDWATDKKDVIVAYKTGQNAIEMRSYGDEVEFKTADKLYITREAQLKSHILDALTYRQIERVDFRRPEAVRVRINYQIEDATNHHIKDLLQPGSVTSNMKAVLSNAAFFKGTWLNKFDKDMTTNATFYGATNEEAEMMYVKTEVFHGELADEDAEFVELDYKEENNSIMMTVIMPKTGSVDDLVKKLTIQTFENIDAAGTHEEIAVMIPKMSFGKSYFLGSILENEMGIKNLFGGSSDLSGFADNVVVSIDDIVHKAVFYADEDGTIAAAATASVGRGMTKMFNANRPFVFMITDAISKEVLFTGIFRGPNL